MYVAHSWRQRPSAADTLYELEDLPICMSVPLSSGTSTRNFLVAMASIRVGGAFTEDGTRRVHPSPATAKCYQCDVPIQRPPSQIDYIMASRRWSTSAHKTRVKLEVSCQRWGRHYDHELVATSLTRLTKSLMRHARHFPSGIASR